MMFAEFVAAGLLILAAARGTDTVGPRFVSERIRIDVDRTEVRVHGDYEFLRGTDREDFPIFYPFPASGADSDAELLEVRLETTDGAEDLPALVEPAGCRFLLPLSRVAACRVLLSYRQPLMDCHATYILTSTQEWGAPLQSAEFIVRAIGDVRNPIAINYPFVMSRLSPDTMEYRFTAHDFMPDRDLLINVCGDATQSTEAAR